MRTHNALEALEHAKALGLQDAMLERLYVAYWKHGLNINDLDTLKMLGAGLICDMETMMQAIDEKRYRDLIVGFDEPAHVKGIYNVPTFWIGDARYAEQPRTVLTKALRELVEGASA